MTGIDGIVYLLNQAGVALADATQQIARLSEENKALKAIVQDQNDEAVRRGVEPLLPD